MPPSASSASIAYLPAITDVPRGENNVVAVESSAMGCGCRVRLQVADQRRPPAKHATTFERSTPPTRQTAATERVRPALEGRPRARADTRRDDPRSGLSE